jgi:hypothetical protein
MHDNSFYKIFYQNDTLYRVAMPNTAVSQSVVPAQPKTPTPTPPIVATAADVATPPPPTDIVPVVHQKILLIVDESPELSASDAILLEKILNAIGLDLTKVDILNITGAKRMDFRPLLETKKIHHIISFGVPFLKVNIDVMMNRYDPKTLLGVTFLLADPLSVMQEDQAVKRAFWNVLKQLFVSS